jgi:hypothetical protein
MMAIAQGLVGRDDLELADFLEEAGEQSLRP